MEEHNKLRVISSAFNEGDYIPRRYTCEGDSINPPLEILNIPEGTKTIAVIMEDPDAPNGTFTHWIIWNLPPDINIPEGKEHTVTGTNSADATGYYGPCPPKGSHRYYFHVYALDAALSLAIGAKRKDVDHEIDQHLIATGTLMGLYQKNKPL